MWGGGAEVGKCGYLNRKKPAGQVFFNRKERVKLTRQIKIAYRDNMFCILSVSNMKYSVLSLKHFFNLKTLPK